MDQCLEYAEPEPPEPARFAWSRSRSPQDVLLGAGAGVGAEMLSRNRRRSRSRQNLSRLCTSGKNIHQIVVKALRKNDDDDLGLSTQEEN